MAIAPKANPASNATNGMSSAPGSVANPNARTTTVTMLPLITLFVAPQSISPVITSSMLTGVATMASNVFW
jgi:hypothetical protein